MKALIFPLAVGLTMALAPVGRAGTVAVEAINSLGIDLLRQTASPQSNVLFSPYSIQTSMTMALAGAEGDTREEMLRALHYPNDEDQVNQSFADLREGLADIVRRQAAEAVHLAQYGITNDTLTLATASRVFVEKDYNFRPAYLDLMHDTWHLTCDPVDFHNDAAGVALYINSWVAAQTHGRIRDLLPRRGLDPYTRMVLASTVYFKAPWATRFDAGSTQPATFNLPGGGSAEVPTMRLDSSLGYARTDGCQIVSVPYAGQDIQFLIILPDATNGLAAAVARLKSETLEDCAAMPPKPVHLFLPKLDVAPAAMSLARAFQALGMRSAFDEPRGSANFDRMSPRGPDKYLYISDIIHKASLKLDESGTEAAAATSVVMVDSLGITPAPPPPVEVRVDHPFLFAIQDRTRGACLFLGQVVDPR